MVTGYASSVSVSINDSIDFYLSTDKPGMPHHFVIQRWGAPAISLNLDLQLSSQQEPSSKAWEGFKWKNSHTLSIPSNFSSGLYSLIYEGEDIADFVVRPETPGATSRVLFQISFLTPQAYNGVGGHSLYPNQSNDDSTRASRVSFDRPGCFVDTRFEKPFIQWLDAEAYSVEYCSSLDLHLDSTLLFNYDCLIIVGHDEYWTKAMRDNVEHFVANGGNFVVLSGNTCFRQVRLEDNERTLVFYKYAGADPNPDDTEKTVVFSEPPVNRPPNTLFGVGFDHGAAGWIPSPYTIHFSDHWVFNGLQPPAGQPWRTSPFLVYEADGAAFVFESEGYPRVTGTDGTPSSFVVLGSADLREWGPKPGFATMGIYSRGGTVFNAGTTAWVEALRTDPVIAQVSRNVLDRLRHPQVWDWELVGHANEAVAMTALEGKLFLVTADGRLWRRYPVGANVIWTEIGHAYQPKALAGAGDTLYCISQDNQLWWRSTVEENVNWTPIGEGPAGGTKALAASRDMLYAIDQAGYLVRRPASRVALPWSPAPNSDPNNLSPSPFLEPNPAVVALTAHRDILFATTSSNRLLRSNRDWLDECTGWLDIHHCNYPVGLGVVDGMLFAATSDDRLWRLDLYHLHKP